MIDKSWMLNPQAIRHAKTCIQIIKERLNLKLKLSQADFFYQLEDCIKKTRSFELIAAHHQLMAMAKADGVELVKDNNNIVSLVRKDSQRPARAVDSVEINNSSLVAKQYPKWQHGKELRGMYRGQPTFQ